MALTKRTINLGEHSVKVGWSFVKIVDGFPFDDKEGRDMQHNQFSIKVYGKDGKTGKTFQWYDSYSNYLDGVTGISDRTLLDVLENIIKEGLDGIEYSFEDFCDELGFDTDSRRAERSYKACQRDGKKLLELYDEQELREMLDALYEIETGDRKAAVAEA